MKALPLDFTLRLLTVYKAVIVHILNNAQHSQTEVSRHCHLWISFMVWLMFVLRVDISICVFSCLVVCRRILYSICLLPLQQVDRRVLQSALKVLHQLHEENFRDGSHVARLAYEEFYIPEIGEKIDIRSDYLNWVNSRLRPTLHRSEVSPFPSAAMYLEGTVVYLQEKLYFTHHCENILYCIIYIV